MSDEERSRLAAAEVVAGWVEPDTTIGLGSGRAVRAVIAALAARWPDGVPLRAAVASQSSASAAREAGIEIVWLSDAPLAAVIDGADEVDADLQLLKGGGGALLHEKVLADAGGGLVVVAESCKHVARLGLRSPLPIEVVRFGVEITSRRIADLLAPPVLRLDTGGEPFVTEEGHLLLDTPLREVDDLHALATQLSAIPGVVEHGLFLDMARAVVLGGPDGTAQILGQRP
jgi:ribose 5-phosphate isomerase A